MKKKKGFTLIEVIIVIGIIGVLATIAVPKFNDIQKKAKISADIASAKVIADAVMLKYSEDGTGLQGEIGKDIELNEIGLQSIPEVKLNKNNKFYVKSTDGVITVYVYASGKDLKDLNSLSGTNQIYPKPEEDKVKNGENKYYPNYGK